MIFRLFSGLALLSGCTTFESDVVERTTICELANNPERYSNRIVEVSGPVTAAHHIRLFDDACPDVAIDVAVPRSPRRRRNVDQFWSELFAEGTTVGRSISATLVGVFSPHPGEFPAGDLLVQDVRVYTVAPPER